MSKNTVATVVVLVGLLLAGAFVFTYNTYIEREPQPSLTEEILPPAEDEVPVDVVVPVEPISRHFVQLSSHRTKEEAEKAVRVHGAELRGIVSASLLQVYQVTVQSGVWYRVVLPTASRSQADRTCRLVKEAGEDCLVLTFDR